MPTNMFVSDGATPVYCMLCGTAVHPAMRSLHTCPPSENYRNADGTVHDVLTGDDY